MTRTTSRKNLPKVYFDSCCFIDMIAYASNIEMPQDRVDGVLCCKKLIKLSFDNEITVITSTLTKAECLYVSDKNISKDYSIVIQQGFKWMLDSQRSGVFSMEPIGLVLDKVRELQWTDNIGIKVMDSIHLATALHFKCVEFITTDDNTIINPHKNAFAEKGLNLIHPNETSFIKPNNQLELDCKEWVK